MAEELQGQLQPPIALPYTRWARNCGITLFVVSGMSGGIQVAFPESAGLYYVFSLMMALSALFWARYDALSRGMPIVRILQMLYLLLWPIGATIYLVTRSGWRGLAAALLYGAGLLLLMALASFATFYCLHFAGLLDAQYYAPR
jgi:hypothetical protein